MGIEFSYIVYGGQRSAFYIENETINRSIKIGKHSLSDLFRLAEYSRTMICLQFDKGAFHLVRTHPRGRWGGGFKSPMHFHCVLHTEMGGGGSR